MFNFFFSPSSQPFPGGGMLNIGPLKKSLAFNLVGGLLITYVQIDNLTNFWQIDNPQIDNLTF